MLRLRHHGPVILPSIMPLTVVIAIAVPTIQIVIVRFKPSSTVMLALVASVY